MERFRVVVARDIARKLDELLEVDRGYPVALEVDHAHDLADAPAGALRAGRKQLLYQDLVELNEEVDELLLTHAVENLAQIETLEPLNQHWPSL